MRVPSVVAILALAACVIVAGCAKKAPATVPVSEPAPAAAPEPEAPPPEPPAAAEPSANPLDGDLDAVNRYLQEQGLLGDVFYDYDSHDLHEEARRRLEQNADFMKGHPQFAFTLEGHCDERGSVAYNVALGDRRANSAKSYLAILNVAPERMHTVTYGEERPFCDESHEGCWRQNRRTHFIVTDRRTP